MKRALSLLLTILMVFSLFPTTALAAEEPTPGEGDVAATSAAPEATEPPAETPAPESTPTEAQSSESPSVDALFLNLLGCDSIDGDGVGHLTRKFGSVELWDLTAKCETNGSVSYRWQTLDQNSTASDPYVDIDSHDNPTANDKKLTIPANADALGVKDFYRCVVTATFGEESIEAYYCFTVEQIDDAAGNTPTPAPLPEEPTAGMTPSEVPAEPTPTPELPLTPEGALDMTTAAGEYYAMSIADIKYAIQSGKTNIFCTGSFSITENLTIPAGYSLTIRYNYYTVTVPSGITLTNKGTINVHSMGYLDISGTLSNYGTVECSNGGTITVYDGAHYQAASSGAKLIRSELSEGPIALINGVSDNQIQYVFVDTTGYDFYTGFESAQADYLSKEIYLNKPAEIDGTNHATIPSGTDVYLQSDMTISSTATLTNNGTLYVLEGNSLINHGTVENNGDIYVFGTLENDGTMTGNPYSYLVDVNSDATLRAAIDANATDIYVQGSFTLSSALTIPDGTNLILNGYTITVPSGVKLTNQGSIHIPSLGKLLIKSGATLANQSSVEVYGGALTMESGGVYQTSGTSSIRLDIAKAGSVTGIATSFIEAYSFATTETMIRTALNYGGKGYQSLNIYVGGSISLASNMTIPSDVMMLIGFDGDSYRLTVPTGKTLTNNGYINVPAGNTLQLNAGATLVNNGQIEVFGEFIRNGTVSGSGTITNGNADVDAWEALKDAVAANRGNINITSDVIVAENITIGPGTALILPKDSTSTLTIPDGVTLTLDGYLPLYGGAVVVQSGGKLVVNGYIFAKAGTFTVEAGGTLENNNQIDLSGTATVTLAAGTYVAGTKASFFFDDSSGASISSDDVSFVSYNTNVADSSELLTALNAGSLGYNSVLIDLYGDAQLSDDFDLASSVYLVVEPGCTLTIDLGKTLTLNGSLEIKAGATLSLLEGASIVVADGAQLTISGTLSGTGTITGDYSLSVSTEAALRDALASGLTSLTVSGTFSLSQNLTIPEGTSVSIDGGILTVPLGKTLQVDGYLGLMSGTVNVLSGGKLINNYSIDLYNSSRLNILSGASYTQAPAASLSFTYGLDAISGVAKNLIDCEYEASSESSLRTGLALTGYRSLTVDLFGDVTLTSNLTVPANVTLMLLSWNDLARLTVPSLKTLTVNGIVSIQEDSVLNIALGGTLNVSATGSVQILGGKLIADGTVNYANGAQIYRDVYSEAELRDAIENHITQAMICADIELTDDLAIPDTTEVALSDGKTLTVPTGTTLSIGKTNVWLTDGALVVDGALTLANGGKINIDDSGALTLNGSISFGGHEARILFTLTGTSSLTGLSDTDGKYVEAKAFASTVAELTSALAGFEGSPYLTDTIVLSDSITLEDDITVPLGVALLVHDGITLTVPAVNTLTIDGSLTVEPGGKLVLLGTLENNGAVRLALGSRSGDGTLNNNSNGLFYNATVTSLAQLKAAIDSGKRPLLIDAGSFVISSNLVIPADVQVTFQKDSTVSIASGVTLTNNGWISIFGKFTNAGTLINNYWIFVERTGTLINNNIVTNNGDFDVFGLMLNNAIVTVKPGCRIRFQSGGVKGGTKAIGTWYSLDTKDATGIEIVGPEYISITSTSDTQYIAQMLPTDAWPVEVTWTIESGDEFATIDDETGKLHAIAKGDVVIRATSVFDDAIYSEMTVHVISYALKINGADWMVSGKTLQLTGEFLPSNLTKTTIVWALETGDSAYASISATGLVTAKALTEPKQITVIALGADGAVDAARHTITIHPVLSGMQLINDGKDATGKTFTINSYSDESLQFTCSLIPENAKSEIVWTLSDESVIAQLTENGDGSMTVTPIEGKAKLITLTAKATDGSGKTASVKIQVVAQSSGVTVSGAKDDMLSAGKNVQLVAKFSDPQPSSTAVKWTLSPEYDAFATLSSTGLLTAKAVTEAVVVRVVAVPTDGGPASDPYEVTINPLTNQLQLMRGETYVTNTTQTVDLGHESTLQLTAVAWPYSASQEFTFSSSMPSIATVSETGEVTALKVGLVTITAKATDGSGKIANVKLNIVKLPQTIWAVTPVLGLRGGASATYRVKDATTAANVILPASMVRWTLDGDYSNVAKITTGGVLTTYAVNTPQTIMLKAEVIGNEEIANTTLEVTIYPAMQRIQLYNGSEPFKGPVVFDTFGKTEGGIDDVTLTAKTIPSDAMQDVAWISSNTTIATVNNGVVSPVWNTATHAYNKGVAIITARAKDGTNLSVSTAVQVMSLAQSVTLTTVGGADKVASGSSIQLKATLGNPLASNPKVYYSITSGAEYATVSTSGLVTAKVVFKDQIIAVKATAADGSGADEIPLTIQPKEADPLVIQPYDGSTTYNGTRQSFDISGAAAAVKIVAVGATSGEPVSVKWAVSPSTVGKVSIIGGIATLQSLRTGVVTVTATDAKGRTASFTAEFYKPASTLTIKPPKGMDVSALRLSSGKTMQLTATIAPTTGVTTSGVNWYIGVDIDGGIKYYKDTTLASISSTGLVTAKTGLTALTPITIYAVTKNAPYLTNSVTITLTPAATGLDIRLDSDVVNNRTIVWDIAATPFYLSALVYPDTANQTVTWSSSDSTIAKIAADGKVTAIKAGTVTITAKADAKVATFKLTLSVLTTGIDITSKTGFAMRAGGTLQLAAAFTPANASDKRVRWTLLGDGAQFATLSSTGLVTAKASTKQQTIEVLVTSLADTNLTSKETITIYPATTKVLILDSEANDVTGKTVILDLNEATDMSLSAKNLPSMDGGALQSVVWKSSNTAVLRVAADGTLTPVKNATTGLYYTGTVTITATATDGSGKYATVKVFVGYLVKWMTFADGLTVKGGYTLTLKPTFDPVNATNKAVKWTIKASDTPYATISSTGVITAKKLTEARDITVYCEALDGSGVMVEVIVKITV